MADGSLVPDWLRKWAALVCEFLETEQRCLFEELLGHPKGLYTRVTAEAGARCGAAGF